MTDTQPTDTPAVETAAPSGVVIDSPVIVEAPAPAPADASAPASHTSAAADTTTATTPEGAAAEAAGATPAQVAEIEARLNGQPYKLPAGIEIPWKRGNEEGYSSLDEIRRSPMFERDYRHKTAELAEQRRTFQTERVDYEKQRRQLDVERAFVEKEQARVLEALTSPDEEVRARHAMHFEMLRTDPDYRERYVKSLKADAYEASQAVDSEIEQRAYIQNTVADIQQSAQELSKEFPGVDTERVLQRYGHAVSTGSAPLRLSALRAVFEDEHKHVSQYAEAQLQPVRSELDALKAEIAALRATNTGAAHNARVRDTLAKASSSRAVAATGATAPPSPSAVAPVRQKPRDRQEAHRQFLGR